MVYNCVANPKSYLTLCNISVARSWRNLYWTINDIVLYIVLYDLNILKLKKQNKKSYLFSYSLKERIVL